MGNCLPVIFGIRRGAHDAAFESSRSSSIDTSAQLAPLSFSNPIMGPMPYSSPYVNQLYAHNMARQRQAADEGKEREDARKLRVKGLLDQIPADIFRTDMKSSECAICMIDFEPGVRIRFLPCMHSFHQECVDAWLMKSFTCPSCLEPVDSTILSSLTAHTQQSLQDLACSPATQGLSLPYAP